MLKPETLEIQNSLGNYCRGDTNLILKGHCNENLPYYRKLVLNVVHDALSRAYPISRQSLEEEKWNELIELFFAEHKCRTNQLWKLPEEFIEYIKRCCWHKKIEVPHFVDLLRLEWSEIEVFMMQNHKVEFSPVINWKEDVLVLNPYLQILHLEYPVHLLKKNRPLEPRISYILCYRGWEDFRVYYLEVSILGKILLEHLKEKQSIKKVLSSLTKSLQKSIITELYKEVESFFRLIAKRKIILGRHTKGL